MQDICTNKTLKKLLICVMRERILTGSLGHWKQIPSNALEIVSLMGDLFGT